MKRIISILIINIILLHCSLQAQQTTVKSSLDTTVIKIGEQVNYSIIAETTSEEMLKWPVIRDTLSKQLEVVDMKEPDTTRLDGGFKRISYHYVITSFDSGYHVIPPQTVIVGGDSLLTDPLLLEVKTMNVDTTAAIKPIKGIYEVPLRFRDVLPYIVVGLILAVIILVLIFYFRRRKTRQPQYVPKPKPDLPPHIEAMKRLEELEDKKLWQEGHIKRYHIELTAIIRHYTERRFGIESEELTTRETLDQTKPEISSEAFDKLKDLLELGDLVKFARYKPMPDENSRSAAQAKEFVELTREQEQQQGEEK